MASKNSKTVLEQSTELMLYRQKYMSYKEKVKQGRQDIEQCGELINAADNLKAHLDGCSAVLSNVDAEVSGGGLIVYGKSATAGKIEPHISNISSQIGALDDFIAAATAEKAKIQTEVNANTVLMNQYYKAANQKINY